MDDKLEEIIEKTNYIVRVQLDSEDNDIITVDFAEKKKCYYRLEKDDEGYLGIAYYSDLFEYSDEECIWLDPTIIRLYIMTDIYRQCKQLKLPLEIVRYYDSENNKVEFVDLVDLELNEEQQQVEMFIEKIATIYINKGFIEDKIMLALEKDRLLHSFLTIKSLLI